MPDVTINFKIDEEMKRELRSKAIEIAIASVEGCIKIINTHADSVGSYLPDNRETKFAKKYAKSALLCTVPEIMAILSHLESLK